MELNIDELDNASFESETFEYEQEQIHSSFEQIPENTVNIKKRVKFVEQNKPTHQKLPRENSKIVRQKIPNPKPTISYEDILSKMGMFVADGQLHLMDNNPQRHREIANTIKNSQQQERYNQQEQYQNNIPQNSYIYNKYFKEEIRQEDNNSRPMTLTEYKKRLVENYIQKQRINQIKSRKLIMPTSNINIAPGNSANLNKLFSFPKR